MSQEEIVVPKGWTVKKVSEITKSYSGGTPSRFKHEYWENGTIPWLRSGDLKNNLITKAVEFITDKGLKESSARLWPKNSVVIALTGANTGRTGILDFECCGNQSIVGILPNEIILSKYLWYYMQFSNAYFWSKAIGGAQPHINGKIVSEREIIFPENKETQKKIVKKLDHILGELEVKKKEIISLIEQNKERIDFFEKNWINYIISTLIPKKEIPNGWSLLPLSEICNVERGKFGHRPRNDPAFYGGKYPFIQTGDVARSNGRVSKFSQTLNEKGFKVSRMFPKGTVVITIAANIGDTAILEFDSCFPDSLIGITPITGKTIAEYVEYALRLYQKDLTRDASQGTQKNINYDFLKPLLIPIPKTITEQENIVRKIKSAEEKFQSQKKQFENIKNNYESKINYINHIQSSILDSAFSGKLLN